MEELLEKEGLFGEATEGTRVKEMVNRENTSKSSSVVRVQEMFN